MHVQKRCEAHWLQHVAGSCYWNPARDVPWAHQNFRHPSASYQGKNCGPSSFEGTLCSSNVTSPLCPPAGLQSRRCVRGTQLCLLAAIFLQSGMHHGTSWFCPARGSTSLQDSEKSSRPELNRLLGSPTHIICGLSARASLECGRMLCMEAAQLGKHYARY